jgi:hypothetical protein
MVDRNRQLFRAAGEFCRIFAAGNGYYPEHLSHRWVNVLAALDNRDVGAKAS